MTAAAEKYLPLIFPDLSIISAREKQVIDSVLDGLSSRGFRCSGRLFKGRYALEDGSG